MSTGINEPRKNFQQRALSIFMTAPVFNGNSLLSIAKKWVK